MLLSQCQQGEVTRASHINSPTRLGKIYSKQNDSIYQTYPDFMSLSCPYVPAGVILPLAGLGFTGLQAWRTYKASDEGRIRQAVKKMLKPYPDPEERVVPRGVMQTIKGIITAWSRQTKRTTIVTGRYQAGKIVAVNEALRGVRGVFQFDVKSADWEKIMYEKMVVSNEGMFKDFKEVLRRVRVELKKFPDNPTKFPILLLEVHREVVGGGHL